ncbi:SDR family NAD(P)-dependent oxidoreductase [Rhodobacteraceae bacterium D3-12]|nr:SDR family NAD(P)-dependent oxidoreductase [Rhodobacteraceae bacterium D3-12]
MTNIAGKTYWLIGASEGLGRALAIKLNAEGARLILSARNGERLESLRAQLVEARVVAFDVTDADAVLEAAAKVGDVDGMIYNVGTYEPMPATQWDAGSALMMCETNFIGAMRVLGNVLPGLIEKGRGDITLVGSLAGYNGLPKSIGYGASKAALVSLAETMRFDLKGTGVTVRLVNPGFIKTRLTEKNEFRMPMLMTPEKAAEKVLKAMRKRRFRTDFPAPFSWAIRSLAFIPDWLLYRGK